MATPITPTPTPRLQDPFGALLVESGPDTPVTVITSPEETPLVSARKFAGISQGQNRSRATITVDPARKRSTVAELYGYQDRVMRLW